MHFPLKNLSQFTWNTEREDMELQIAVFISNELTGITGKEDIQKTVKGQQILTERTGAFKDRAIREEDETPGIKLTINVREKLGHREYMGSKTHKTFHNPDMSPPSQKVRPRTVETSKGEGWVGTTEVAQEEDEPTGGVRQTESKGATKEGGAREETWGARSRKSTAGPRPQPWWWPTVELTEGGAMEEEWPPTPEGWPTASEQVVVEPEAETESQRARRMPRFRGARVEPRAQVTEAEVLRSASEPEWLRTQIEQTGGRGPTEPVGRSDEAQPKERSLEVMAGQRPNKAGPEGRGCSVELVDRMVINVNVM